MTPYTESLNTCTHLQLVQAYVCIGLNNLFKNLYSREVRNLCWKGDHQAELGLQLVCHTETVFSEVPPRSFFITAAQ